MGNEGGEWIMRGLDWDNPWRIRTPQELLNYINQTGFLPLFANEIPGFSVEEHVSPLFWWTDDTEQDPWKWREILTRSGKVIYGKFYHGRAGFVSRDWFPAFANVRRDGYDFEAYWDDELATIREKKIMDCFAAQPEYYSFELKKAAGFGKEGEKNFEGTVTGLQHKTYLVVRDFRRRHRKKDNEEFGWPISVYTTPEHLLGQVAFDKAYEEDPADSAKRILKQLKREFPGVAENQFRALLK